MQQVGAEKRTGLRLDAATVVGAAVLVVAIVAPLMIQRYLSFDPVAVAAFGYIAILALGFIGSVTFFLPVPVLSLVFAAGTILNPVLLAITAAVGITLGMAAAYLLGTSGNRFVKRAATRQSMAMVATTRVVNWYSTNTAVASFLLAATPNPIFDYAGIIAGAARVSPWRFLIGVFTGKIVQALVVALLGYYAAEQINAIW